MAERLREAAELAAPTRAHILTVNERWWIVHTCQEIALEIEEYAG